MKHRNEAIELMNEWGAKKVPFLFFTDWLGEKVWLERLSDVRDRDVSYSFGSTETHESDPIELQDAPISKEEFKKSFDLVLSEIKFGNSYLTNLTFETPIAPSADLQRIFQSSSAKYKVKYKDQFVCFSPETFVKIDENSIRSYPMKGTINANIPNAKKNILDDPKETAEHVTIVDLIRNDLSQVATDVRVERFRYFDEIVRANGNLLQVSSEIVGDLPSNWKSNIGSILFKLLPAGSISGAPKKETVSIIKRAESHSRNFYTGVCGLFDGESLDSGVMIRFIEKRAGKLFFKSGGGITAFSELDKEYQEYKLKIAVPIRVKVDE